MRIAICGDFPEERWSSMDRVAAMLHDELGRRGIVADSVCPRFTRRATAIAGDFDVFHVVDHSYAHLVHALPAERTVVTCHDLDAFRSVLDPSEERRSPPFRWMTRSILSGLRRAARVTCDTAAVRDELAGRGIIPADRLVVAPLGVGDVFTAHPDPAADRRADTLTQSPAGAIELLHVGSGAPRKRIDVLLRVAAAIRRELADVRVIRVGDPLTPPQRQLATDLGIVDAVVTIDRVDEATLAALYRRAALVLQPSEREGFGLPVVEALASGTPVVASDLAVLREVGGPAVEYCGVGDVDAWRRTVIDLLRERDDSTNRWDARRAQGRAHARQFTWSRFAAQVLDLYRSLVVGAEHKEMRAETTAARVARVESRLSRN
jgi:glycosyltransferase involved in cell wall biosynthesis